MSVSQESACDYWTNANQQLYHQFRGSGYSECRQNYYGYGTPYENTEYYRGNYSCDYQQPKSDNGHVDVDKYKYFANNYCSNPQQASIKSEIEDSLLNLTLFEPCGQPVYNPAAVSPLEDITASTKTTNLEQKSPNKVNDSPALRALLSKPLGKKLRYPYKAQTFTQSDQNEASCEEKQANEKTATLPDQPMEINPELQSFYPWMKTTG